jgi:hypothetical protein
MLNGLDLFSGIGGMSLALREYVRPMKNCKHCNNELVRKRKPCGKLESNTYFKKRLFCNSKCRGNFTASLNKCLPNTARQRTLKLYPKKNLIHCEVCGNNKKRLYRHHKDANTYNNFPENILICCQACHAKEHQRLGKWGRGKKVRICLNCAKSFTHQNRRRKTCSGECFLERCSKIAKKRWLCGSA